MKITVISGSPKPGGFINDSLELVASHLERRGADVTKIRLSEKHINDCIGCFTCLRTGECVIHDDVGGIIDIMKNSDGFVIGSPVRNALITACLKRFIERITYILGFTLVLEDKYSLGIASVGLFGGKSVSRRFCCLQDVFHTHLSGFVFCSVGIPSSRGIIDKKHKLTSAADKLVRDISEKTPRSRREKLSLAIDKTIVRKFMLERKPDLYASVIRAWQLKGYISS